jgi:hypothetical protein
MIQYIANVGGILFLLTIVHIIVDCGFQSNSTAMVKHYNIKVRALHCLIYSLCFIPIMLLLELDSLEIILALDILYFSHLMEDSYLPVYLWARYIRKPQEMRDDPSIENFIKFTSTPLGKILSILIDQTIHVLFLIPIAIFATN